MKEGISNEHSTPLVLVSISTLYVVSPPSFFLKREGFCLSTPFFFSPPSFQVRDGNGNYAVGCMDSKFWKKNKRFLQIEDFVGSLTGGVLVLKF